MCVEHVCVCVRACVLVKRRDYIRHMLNFITMLSKANTIFTAVINTPLELIINYASTNSARCLLARCAIHTCILYNCMPFMEFVECKQHTPTKGAYLMSSGSEAIYDSSFVGVAASRKESQL